MKAELTPFGDGDRYPAKYALWPVRLTGNRCDVSDWLFGWFRWFIAWYPPTNHSRDWCACSPRGEHQRSCIEHPAQRREIYGVTIALGPLRLVLGAPRNTYDRRRSLSMTDARRYRREQRLQRERA